MPSEARRAPNHPRMDAQHTVVVMIVAYLNVLVKMGVVAPAAVLGW